MFVNITDVLLAQRLLRDHLPPTPLWSYPQLNALAGTTIFVKHENIQPVGAFKIRGGLTLVAGLTPAERVRGVVTYSTGNHAQSIAYASRVFGVRCIVVMPEGANEAKIRATRAQGATVVLKGAGLEGAGQHAAELANIEDMRLVSPGDEPALLAGVGTTYLEILEKEPDLDAVIVPVGSGTGASGACLVAAALAPKCEIIAVQSDASPAGHDSWRAGECVARPDATTVEGIATSRGFELPQSIMRGGLSDFLLVTDAAIAAAQRLLASHAHTLAEGAGAAGLAAVLSCPDRFAGRRVAVVVTGGNAKPAELAALAAQ